MAKINGLTVEAGGKNRLFRYSYKAMKGTCAELGVEAIEDLPSVLTKPSFGAIEALMFQGFKAGAEYQKEEVDFDRDDLAEWIDDDMELFPLVLREVSSQLSEAIGGPDAGKKKQSTGKAAPKLPKR